MLFIKEVLDGGLIGKEEELFDFRCFGFDKFVDIVDEMKRMELPCVSDG